MSAYEAIGMILVGGVGGAIVGNVIWYVLIEPVINFIFRSDR